MTEKTLDAKRMPAILKRLAADRLEGDIWQHCREFIHQPGEALAEAQQQLRERMAESTTLEEQRATLLAQLAEKEL